MSAMTGVVLKHTLRCRSRIKSTVSAGSECLMKLVVDGQEMESGDCGEPQPSKLL